MGGIFDMADYGYSATNTPEENWRVLRDALRACGDAGGGEVIMRGAINVPAPWNFDGTGITLCGGLPDRSDASVTQEDEHMSECPHWPGVVSMPCPHDEWWDESDDPDEGGVKFRVERDSKSGEVIVTLRATAWSAEAALERLGASVPGLIEDVRGGD